MAAEGEFPKIGGDIIYASEANRFAGAPAYVQYRENFGEIGSVSVGSIVGSVVIEAGKLSNPSYLDIDLYTTPWGGGRTGVVSFGFSGADADMNIPDIGSITGGLFNAYQKFQIVLGDNVSGAWRNIMSDQTGINAGAYLVESASNGNPSSGLVVSFKFLHNGGGANKILGALIKGNRTSL